MGCFGIWVRTYPPAWSVGRPTCQTPARMVSRSTDVPNTRPLGESVDRSTMLTSWPTGQPSATGLAPWSTSWPTGEMGVSVRTHALHVTTLSDAHDRGSVCDRTMSLKAGLTKSGEAPQVRYITSLTPESNSFRQLNEDDHTFGNSAKHY